MEDSAEGMVVLIELEGNGGRVDPVARTTVEGVDDVAHVGNNVLHEVTLEQVGSESSHDSALVTLLLRLMNCSHNAKLVGRGG